MEPWRREIRQRETRALKMAKLNWGIVGGGEGSQQGGTGGNPLGDQISAHRPAPFHLVFGVQNNAGVRDQRQAQGPRLGPVHLTLAPEKCVGAGCGTGLQHDRLMAYIVDIGTSPLLRAADFGVQILHHVGDGRTGVVKISADDGLLRADHRTGRLQATFHPVGTEVALLNRSAVLIEIKRIVRASLHAGPATDAGIPIQIDDAVGALIQSVDGADGDTGRIAAVVAAQHGKVPAHVREATLLGVLDPCAEAAYRHIVLGLAGHGASVAADAASMIDEKSVLHRASLYDWSPAAK